MSRCLTLMNKASFLTLVASTSLLVAPLAAQAGSSTGTMAVTANILASCTITAQPLAFGGYDGANANATAALQVNTTVATTCTNGSVPTIAMGAGNNSTAAQRYVKDSAADLLKYNLYIPSANTAGAACAYTTAWGDGTAATTGSSFLTTVAPSIVARTYNVCGSIPAGQDKPVGSYTDSVITTVSF